LTRGIDATSNPTVIILGGQPGAGKTELEKLALKELGGHVISCNADLFRDYHPKAEEIKNNYEAYYPEITAKYAQDWNNGLRRYCEANRLNYILETTFSSGPVMNQTIAELQEKGYRVGIKLLAVHPLLSLLGTHIRFEEMKAKEKAGRLVGKEAHDARYNLVAPTLYSVQSESLYNRLQIYGRTVEAVEGSYKEGVHLIGTNPPNAVQLYQEEIDRRWTDNLVLYFDQRVQKVLDFMKMRNAPEKEVKAFRAEMRSEYPTQKQLQVLIEQQIEEQKVTERLNRRLAGALPTINLAGTEFTIDWRLRELRESAAPWNKISFENPAMSESGDRYLCLYNTQKHTLYQVSNNIKSLPKNVVMLEIPYELKLDPVAVARERNIDTTEFVRNHPIQAELTAVVKPLSETWVAELIQENLRNNQAIKKGKEPGEDFEQGYNRGPSLGR
jgi:predicted ABC-type ATPase